MYELKNVLPREESAPPFSSTYSVFLKKKNPDNRKTHFKRKCVYDVLCHFFKISNCIVELPSRYFHVSSIKGSATQFLTDIRDI